MLSCILYSAIAVFVIEILGICICGKKNKVRNYFLLGCVVAIIILSSCLHFYYFIEHTNVPGAVAWSILSSLELFAGIAHLELLGIAYEPNHVFYSAYILLWVMSVVSSVMGITFTFFQKRLSLHSTVRKFRNETKNKAYIIFGVSNASVKLAGDILKTKKIEDGKKYIIVLDVKQDKTKSKLSILDFIKNAFGHAPRSFAERVAQETDNPNASSRIIELDSRISCITHNLGDLKSICSAIGYSSLKTVAEKANIYFMTDDENHNIESSLSFAKAAPNSHIFCHASIDDAAKLYSESSILGNITYVDSSYLAIEYLKKNPQFHPVNFVHVAQDAQGRKLGYVDSEFNSLILGFGETGKLALSFLYSFAAFPAKDRKRSPFKCTVYDKAMDNLIGNYRAQTPGVDHSLIDYRNGDARSQSLYDQAFLAKLNYVVVSLGNDRTNLSVAASLLENIYKAKGGNLDNFIMLVRVLHEDDSSSEIIQFYQSKYWKNGASHLYTFGGESEIWTEKVISNEDVYEASSQYLDAYNVAKGVNETGLFHKRHEEIIKNSAALSGYTGESFLNMLSLVNKLKRQELQDIENTTHSYTKRELCDPSFYNEAKFITSAYPEHDGGEIDHYIGNDNEAKSTFEYLAICEHLRWVSSHAMAGFRSCPDAVTDELMKIHQCMIPYDELNHLDTPENTGLYKHYDWLVVKTSLAFFDRSQFISYSIV